MKALQKTFISLLITSIIFILGTIAFHTEIMQALDLYMYQPKRMNHYGNLSLSVSNTFDKYYEEVNEVFADFIVQKCVSSFMEYDPSEKDVQMRDSLVNYLFVRLNDLEGIRLVENDGNKVHFSTYSEDKRTSKFGDTDFKDYPALNEIPFYIIEALDEGIIADSVERIMLNCHLYLDGKKNRFIFSYPLYDAYTAHRGTFVFYLSCMDFAEYLMKHNLINVGQHVQIVGTSGIAIGVPVQSQSLTLAHIEDFWNTNHFGMQRLIEGENSDNTYMIFSNNNAPRKINFGVICTETDLSLSNNARILLMLNLYISIMLVVLLALNYKKDPITFISYRIQKLQYSLIKNYVMRKKSEDWKSLSADIAQRKMDLNMEFKKNMGSLGKKYSKEIDAMLDETWHLIASIIAFDRSNGMQPFLPETANSKDSSFTPSRFPSYIVEDLPTELGDEQEEVEFLEPADDDDPVAIKEIHLNTNTSSDDDVMELEAVDEAEEVEELEEVEDLEAADDVEELEEVPEAEVVEPAEKVSSKPEMEEVSNAEFGITNTTIQVEEITFDDYLRINFMIKGLDEFSERERLETEENFPVTFLDFSSLDEWEAKVQEAE